MNGKCPHHDKVSQDIANLYRTVNEIARWKEGDAVKQDKSDETAGEIKKELRIMNKCLSQIKHDLAKNYVTKAELDKVSEKVDTDLEGFKGRLIKIVTAVIAGAVFLWEIARNVFENFGGNG